MTNFIRVGFSIVIIATLVSACAYQPSSAPTSHAEPIPPSVIAIPGAQTPDQLLAYPIRFYLDIPYAGTQNPQQTLDLYLPDQPSYLPMPVVIYLPGSPSLGGMWQNVDKSEAPSRMLPLVTSGDFAVVAVNYRHSTEAQWPAQLHDVKAAVRWVRARAEQYGFDPQRIAVWGREAGGHLALMSGMTNHAQDMAGTLGAYTHIRSDVAAVVNYAGVSDINALLSQPSSIDRASSNAPEALLIGGLIAQQSDLASAASPLHYIRDTAPAVFTAHGQQDTVVPISQSLQLHRALDEAGVEAYLITLLSADSSTARPVDAGSAWAAADARAFSFLRRVLLGHDVEVNTSSID